MAEKSSLPSKCYSPRASSLFAPQRLFVGFSPKGPSDFEATMSPTSILEGKTLASTLNPFFSDKHTRKSPLKSSTTETNHHPWHNGDSRAIGLGIVDAFKNEATNKSRIMLFGSQLRIQITNSSTPAGCIDIPRSPIEFGIKTRRSPTGSGNFGSEVMAPSPRVITGRLSEAEMELSRSEDYTCVIAHGPNPRTTHIFDTVDVDYCSTGFTGSKEDEQFTGVQAGYLSDDVLSFCHACKKSLQQGKDIFMYRGEMAFCSVDCRCQQMFFDQEKENFSSDPQLSL